MLGAGTLAPGIELAGFRLDPPAGPVLIAFFKASCPTCQLAFPYLQTLAGKSSLRIVGISQDDAETVAEFREALQIRFEIVLDPAPAYRVSNAYGLTHVPALFLVESDGRIGWHCEGFSKPDLEALARRWGVVLFPPGDRAPVFKPG